MTEFSLDGRRSKVRISRYAPNMEVSVDGQVYRVEPLPSQVPGSFRLSVEGEEMQGWCGIKGASVYLRLNGRTHELVKHELRPGEGRGAQEGEICAELPGNLLSIHCSPGDKVRAGDLLMITESMKMEVRVLADRDGEVGEIFLETGQSFDQGEPLMRLANL